MLPYRVSLHPRSTGWGEGMEGNASGHTAIRIAAGPDATANTRRTPEMKKETVRLGSLTARKLDPTVRGARPLTYKTNQQDLQVETTGVSTSKITSRP